MATLHIPELKEYYVSLRDYHEKFILGQGTFGRVWLGESISTKWTVAVKEILTSSTNPQSIELFKREIQILAKCKNQFLLEFIGFTIEPPFCIITSYMSGGSLWDVIHQRRIILNPTQKTNIAIGIAHGMRYLHDHKIIHRDLKSPNVLLDERLLPRVSDFGLSRITSESQKMTGKIGTPMWMAPEIMNGEAYGLSVDVYAFGIILWELYTEREPFQGLDPSQVFSGVMVNDIRPELPEKTSSLSLLIQQCWARNPRDRPTFESICCRFMNHEIMFPDSDLKGIDVLLREIRQQEKLGKFNLMESAKYLNDIRRIRKASKGSVEIQDMLSKEANAGNIEELAKLIAAFIHEADLNGKDSKGRTPIHAAIEGGQLMTVDYLLKTNGVDMTVTDAQGLTPLKLAKKLKQKKITHLIEAFYNCGL